ncbi:MAG TPA: hypothetical protein VHB50_00925 [Bryobacteraceae bacterium]|nr:hypothetical protein [Bryobacteraceae bacterium]
MQDLHGSFWVLVLYDVAEQIDLAQLRGLIGAPKAEREPTFKHPAPEYVRFERPPVVETLDPISLASGETFQCRIRYFDYGVVSVELERGFIADWNELASLSSRWISAPEIEKCTLELMKRRVERVNAAFVQPYGPWLSEDYYVIHIREAPFTAAEMLALHRGEIARIVRGESRTLSEAEAAEALQSSMSYYPSDLLVVGWVAALIYDTPDGAAPALELLEYANTQLLEFRHYDDVLTRVLEDVYKALEHRGGLLRRWRMAREAGQLNAMRLDITELTERMDTSIKFLSDMFYARAYRVAAARVGVTDYRNLVERKLRTAEGLYEFMMNEFYQARSFLLEAMVVAILVIELVHLFRGGI